MHYSAIASGSACIKDAIVQGPQARDDNVLCSETEAAGVMNSVLCFVIRGVSNYANPHSRSECKKYMAAYAQSLLSKIPLAEV